MNLRPLLVIASSFALSSIAVSQPKLEVVEGLKFDFGSVNRGTVVEKKLSLKNVGTDTLNLGAVDVSCGCTGTIVSEQRILPGKSGSILITFNSKNFSPGPVHKAVTISSNSEGSPRTMIEFTATIVEEITLTPPQIWFKDAQVGILSTATITMKNQGKSALRLTGFQTSLKGFSMTLPEGPIEPGASAQISVEYKPAEVHSVLSDGVFVSTTSTSQPKLYIQVYGSVREFRFE